MNRWNVGVLRRNALGHQVATGFNPQFWEIQTVGWLLYGCILMVPWLGEYSIGLMAPNKFVIAATGLLVSTSLRELYRPVLSGSMSTDTRLLGLLVLCGSVVGGVVWDGAIWILLGSAQPLDGLRALGVFEGGAPGLSGAAYHALVLFAWSATYVAAHRRNPRPHPEPPPNGPSGNHIIARDGKRSIVLDPDRIDWIEAAGDYVRVHSGDQKLLLRSTMGWFESRLGPRGHVRIHRSTIVNSTRIRELTRRPNNQYQIRLMDGTILRASRSYSKQLEQIIGLGGGHVHSAGNSQS